MSIELALFTWYKDSLFLPFFSSSFYLALTCILSVYKRFGQWICTTVQGCYTFFYPFMKGARCGYHHVSLYILLMNGRIRMGIISPPTKR